MEIKRFERKLWRFFVFTRNEIIQDLREKIMVFFCLHKDAIFKHLRLTENIWCLEYDGDFQA